ncbi:MAG: GH3 auxin-responsive promoter family protein [Lewinellaceae bacterium]|nr:GH3 auxin-responsive promoter family protein [Lewinellaceae bacterium]
MSLLGGIIRKGAQISNSTVGLRLSFAQQQQRQLESLLRRAQDTEFGIYHGFGEILQSENFRAAFQQQVPAVDYNQMYAQWWSKAHQEDRPNVCWPGLTPYYALSSGTSQASSKYIPLTEDMLRHMKRAARRMFGVTARFPLEGRHFTKSMLMVGSCTTLQQEGQHLYGDLSGIIGDKRPIWLQRYYKPGKAITDLPEWGQRLERIVDSAPYWDIGFAVGNPMWIQMILEQVISRYQLKHIHEIWPNFGMLVHGGVFFSPYKASLDRLMGQPVAYMDSYMASEGFLGYQIAPDSTDMQLLTNAGVYFEFVPFTAENFDDNGELRSSQPKTVPLEAVETGVHYALLLSTVSGAWRYLLGDTVRFTHPEQALFHISGRTKQFLSVCGEHLSIDNLNDAVREVDTQLQAGIGEFTVAGIRDGSGWKHRWYLSIQNPDVGPTQFLATVDQVLCRLNDDYAVERKYVLRNLEATIIPNPIFMEWLEAKGKMNGQAKIPRVLKGDSLTAFEAFLTKKGIEVA